MKQNKPTKKKIEKMPKIKVFAYSKKDKEKAEIMNHLISDEEWEQMRKTVLQMAIERELNPLGLIYVSWKNETN